MERTWLLITLVNKTFGERVRMMEAWADYLDELRDAGKVIP